MFGPGAKFAESEQATVELKDDDPDALEAMLRYIYTSEYMEDDGKKCEDWLFHLRVSEVADKYMLKKLEQTAFRKFRELASIGTDLQNVVRMVKTLPTIDYRNDELRAIANGLEAEYFVKLVKQPEYRTMLSADSSLMLSHIDRLAFAHEVVKKNVYKCKYCKLQQVTDQPALFCAICVSVYAESEDAGLCWVEKGFANAA